MTGMAHALLHMSYFKKGLLLAVFSMLFGSVLVSHQAAAGGPIMTGKSYVQGIDRATGTTYGDPRNPFGNNTYPRNLRVYPGDQVTFRYNIINWDPIPFISGNVAIEYHSVDLTGNDSTLFSEPSRAFFNIIPLLPSGYWYGKSSTVTISGPGSDTPGKQFCEYVQTNPTVYDYLDPTTLFPGQVGGVVVGLHKFNTNPDYIAIPLPIITQLGGSFYLGNVMSCAEIAYNYDLVPSITPGDKAGSTINVSSAITNNSLKAGLTPTYTQPTQWQITQFFAAPGDVPASLTGATTTSTKDPCAYLKSVMSNAKVHDCTVGGQSSGQDTVFDKNGIRDPSKGGTAFPNQLPLPTPSNPNDLLCYVLSVNTYRPYQSNPNWRNSKVVCLSPSAPVHPKLQILGDDLRAGGQIITSQAGLDPIFGSWAAYASYAGSQTSNFATGSGLKDGKPAAGLDQVGINSLTFANTQTTFGNFASASTVLGNAGNIKKYFGDLQASSASGPSSGQPLDSLAGGAAPYVVNGPLTIQASTIPKGRTIIIVATDTITIAGDIHYTTDPLSTLSDIPQVVLVAPRITINGNVGQVDAWLVTDLTTGASSDTTKYFINTCTEGGINPRSLTFGATPACKNPLTINGPVITSHLYPNRTAGDDSSDNAAETFASNGDAYLWARNYADTNLGLATTRQTEQPVRY